jgi:hypothetical protein
MATIYSKDKPFDVVRDKIKEGNTYVTRYQTHDYIFRAEGDGKCHYISLNTLTGNAIFRRDGFFYSGAAIFQVYRRADRDEWMWLDESIKADRLVDKPIDPNPKIVRNEYDIF